MNIIKRDGRVVPFDKSKIINAVLGAFSDIDEEESKSEYALAKATNIAEYVEQLAKEKDSLLEVEEIQDLVENGLMSCKRKDVAKQYILYRDHRAKDRKRNEEFNRIIREKLDASNVQNQNANIDEKSFGGRIGEASNELMKKIALEEYVSPLSRLAHESNEIYIHDLSAYAVGNHNCLTIPFDDLLKNGFNTRQTDVRPANSVNTAMQLTAVIFQLQSLQNFGGVAASHLDWTMVPYVRKSFYKHFIDGMKYIEEEDMDDSFNDSFDIYYEKYLKYPKAHKYALDKTEQEIYQAVEGLYHNLNTLQSRSGCQLPFTSLNYGTCTEPEGRMVTKALLQVSIEGLGKLHKTSIFPCGIFKLKRGVNREPGDPNYDLFKLALKSTAQRLYPNYANVDWSGNAGYDPNDPATEFSTMGKRKLQLI